LGELENRRKVSHERSTELKKGLSDALELIENKACIYATGSFGREEAGVNSDLDLHIVGKDDGKQRSMLGKLDEVCVKADLISTARRLGFPEFDGDGAFLNHYSLHDLIDTLGKPEDDLTNTFTARLLLLLESKPLIGEVIYEESIDTVIAAYWRDYEDHKDDFIPAFLVNDILRLWRTLCINYEARTQTQPEEKKAKRKLKNYKLKHSRIMTCYSSILCYLAIYGRTKSVSPQDAKKISLMTPIERLQGILNQDDLKHSHRTIDKLIDQYDSFLKITNYPEDDLVRKIIDGSIGEHFSKGSYEFGETMSVAISEIGNGSRFYRMILV
jgi:hypothetical protein